MKKKILVVDDEKAIVDVLKYNLVKEGYDVFCAEDGEMAISRAMEIEPDLILLDIMLPKLDGFSVCKKLRPTMNTPIIMLTAKEDVVDKIIGLELGADDYMTKPFSIRELLARIKANLRRTTNNADSNIAMPNIFKYKDMCINFDRYEVKIHDKLVDVTNKEYELLKFLINNRGQVYSREEILKLVWKYEFYGDIRTIDVTIRRLREKIEDDPKVPVYIITKRGIGYYFDCEDDAK